MVAFLIAGCNDDSCDPQSSLPCDIIDDNQDECTPAPANCPHSVPEQGNLLIHVSQPLPVRVNIYAGAAYETGILIGSGVPTGTTWSLSLPLGKYSATALYVNGKDSVLAVDGSEVGYDSKGYCDETCFGATGGDLNLQLE
ncbi:MAG TPA: hypothetical protein VHO02_02415 [Fibrobacteria bacterium]|jgi:hypothetical protein|nr:hypothetical protein [Fibrobacteria bacterium]